MILVESLFGIFSQCFLVLSFKPATKLARMFVITKSKDLKTSKYQKTNGKEVKPSEICVKLKFDETESLKLYSSSLKSKH